MPGADSPVDGDLRRRDRALSRPRARPRVGRPLLLRHRRGDQRVRGRLPRSEHGSRARRRRRALVGLRAGVQRVDREGRAEAGVAGRLQPLLAVLLGLGADHRALRPDLAVDHADLRLRLARRRPLPRPLPYRRAAGSVRDRRRDPQHVRPFSVPALTPVFWNVAIIAGLLVGVPQTAGADRLYVYAISILVATVIQFLLPIPWLRRRHAPSSSTGAARPSAGRSSSFRSRSGSG